MMLNKLNLIFGLKLLIGNKLSISIIIRKLKPQKPLIEKHNKTIF